MNEEIIKEAARKLNIPEDTVSEVYRCYFEKMRKCIEEVNLVVRFEPGEEKKVRLTTFAGGRNLYGFQGWTMGCVDDPQVKAKAMENMRKALKEG